MSRVAAGSLEKKRCFLAAFTEYHQFSICQAIVTFGAETGKFDTKHDSGKWLLQIDDQHR
jgi:hypothetical protein